MLSSWIFKFSSILLLSLFSCSFLTSYLFRAGMSCVGYLATIRNFNEKVSLDIVCWGTSLQNDAGILFLFLLMQLNKVFLVTVLITLFFHALAFWFSTYRFDLLFNICPLSSDSVAIFGISLLDQVSEELVIMRSYLLLYLLSFSHTYLNFHLESMWL